MKTKKCYKCNQHKEYCEFGKNKSKPDGLSTECKSCKKALNKTYYNDNSNKVKNKVKEYYYANKEQCDAKNKLCSREYRKKYPDKVRAAKKKWEDKNPTYKADYNRKRRKTDVIYRIKHNLRSRLNKIVKGELRAASAMDMLGCSIEHFKSYMESKFQDGMTWENYGKDGWHIDHIIPLHSFNLLNQEECKKACHFTNLQPLWAKDNMSKGARI